MSRRPRNSRHQQPIEKENQDAMDESSFNLRAAGHGDHLTSMDSMNNLLNEAVAAQHATQSSSAAPSLPPKFLTGSGVKGSSVAGTFTVQNTHPSFLNDDSGPPALKPLPEQPGQHLYTLDDIEKTTKPLSDAPVKGRRKRGDIGKSRTTENVSKLLGGNKERDSQPTKEVSDIDDGDKPSAKDASRAKFFSSFENMLSGSKRSLNKLAGPSSRRNSRNDLAGESEDASAPAIGWGDPSQQSKAGSVPKARRVVKGESEQERVRKSTNSGEDVIPDLAEAEEEDMQVTVAAAPIVRVNTVRTIGELESDLGGSMALMNQIQPMMDGIDLSILIKNALCPPAQLEEPDQAWDWDIIFTQVSTEMQASVPMERSSAAAALI